MYSNIQCNVSQKCQQQICFRPTRSSRTRLIRRILFVNNGRRELKETRSAIRKFRAKQSCLADYTDKFWTKCEATHHHASIKVAVAGERAQFSFDVVFGAVLVNQFVSSIGGESQENGFVSGTKINRYKYGKTPIDNIFVSNEERMTSLTAACFICYHVTSTNVGEHHIRLERKAKSEWKFWIEVAQDG
ncbi:hypothetical protein T05_2450 [Trichinella murrelli]|uniref:Uncharacterized protein n=1 Tax=Trichinella murrelli TaxID=144512 RepID=A0A0V0U175_9BILA|nr:hypothetical protein T05_2450 [Trichinella murrelli]